MQQVLTYLCKSSLNKGKTVENWEIGKGGNWESGKRRKVEKRKTEEDV